MLVPDAADSRFAAPALDLVASDALRGAPFQLVQARITWSDAPPSEGWGRDEDLAQARLKAVAEAVERSAWSRLPRAAFQARVADLARFMPPDDLVRYEPAQYARPGFPFLPFEAAEPRWWVPARFVVDGQDSAVVADCALGPRAFEPAYRARLLTWASSSGCASGLQLEDAVLRAVLELVERDAFMRHWFAQRPGQAVRVLSLPSWAATRLARLAEAGCRAGVQCLALGVHPVWLAWAQHAQRHFTCLGAGCALEPESALATALRELEAQALARLEGVCEVRLRPEQVRTPADHAALYASPGHFRDANALLKPSPACGFDELQGRFRLEAATLYARMQAAGHAPCWTDLSIDEASNLVAGRPMYSVRAFAPGLVPIAFGDGLLPLGMGHRVAEGGRRLHPFT